MKNYKINNNFASSKVPKPLANKACINSMIFYFNFRGRYTGSSACELEKSFDRS